MQLVDQAKMMVAKYSIFNKTAGAFRNIFNPHGALHKDQTRVLQELHKFCYVGVTDHGADPIKMARIAGRREVYNWIVGHIGYEPFDLEMLMKQMQEAENE